MRDLILQGRENGDPVEVENRPVAHPDSDDSDDTVVIGVDHQELGQEVMTLVVLRDGAMFTANDVQTWVAEVLARFKVPAIVEFRESLPCTRDREGDEARIGVRAAPEGDERVVLDTWVSRETGRIRRRGVAATAPRVSPNVCSAAFGWFSAVRW